MRQPPNHLLVEHYAFEVNILCVNFALNTEAEAVLYGGNVFVKVTTHCPDAETTMKNHEVPFFLAKRTFKHHIAEITIKVDAMNVALASMIPQVPLTFLLLLADIPKYTRLLRLLDCVNFMAYDFHFKLHQTSAPTSPLSVSDQTHLLAPFERVSGSAVIQTVVFSGTFDTALVTRMKQAMTHKIAWLRAGA